MTTDGRLTPGFASCSLASQAVFRLALAALSKPAFPFPADFGVLFERDPPMPATLAAMALTLADGLTPVWLSPSLRAASDWLQFHRSVPLARTPDRASLVFAASPGELPPLDELSQGTGRYPDRSATVVLGGVLAESGGGVPVLASGPGVEEERVFEGHGLGRDFMAAWARNRAAYPLGVDAFLAGPGSIAGLPRSLSLNPG
ncbi:MAG: phosphonate C-P lyase system protein PhnH [Deltaproteobacteria bacterium]|jgi:alpha-D-ribose 1-methylphosphonate 5-triphosphate synthase subunit PhnH|nr:phosphonate C-P lyase system protein PhnH [Deltaproteobacteria bacterium]